MKAPVPVHHHIRRGLVVTLTTTFILLLITLVLLWYAQRQKSRPSQADRDIDQVFEVLNQGSASQGASDQEIEDIFVEISNQSAVSASDQSIEAVFSQLNSQ